MEQHARFTRTPMPACAWRERCRGHRAALCLAALALASCARGREAPPIAPQPAGGVAASAPPALPLAWRGIGMGTRCGISGPARIDDRPGDAALLVVHDNKGPGEARLATLAVRSGAVEYREVVWRYDGALRSRHAAAIGMAPDSLPADLEAVAPVPGDARSVFLLTSRGVLY